MRGGAIRNTLCARWLACCPLGPRRGYHGERVSTAYDLNVGDTAGWEGTVHYAAWRGDAAAVAELISEGVDVNAPGAGGRTPLMEVVDEPGDFLDHEQAEVVRLLLAAGASVSARGDNGWTALHHGTRAGPVAITALLDAGADVDAQATDASTPLHCAVEYGNSGAVATLLGHGASAFGPEPLGRHALAGR